MKNTKKAIPSSTTQITKQVSLLTNSVLAPNRTDDQVREDLTAIIIHFASMAKEMGLKNSFFKALPKIVAEYRGE